MYWSDSIAGLTCREAIDDWGEIDGLTIQLKNLTNNIDGLGISVNHCEEKKNNNNKLLRSLDVLRHNKSTILNVRRCRRAV